MVGRGRGEGWRKNSFQFKKCNLENGKQNYLNKLTLTDLIPKYYI